MSEGPGPDREQARRRRIGRSAASLDGLATLALTVVAARSQRPVARDAADDVARLVEAALADGPEVLRDRIAGLIADGVPADTLADDYIPAVARTLGDMWCADTTSFAHVTIGVARLQAGLRTLGPEWHADDHVPVDAPSALFLVGAGFHHTLGGIVAAGQLRRRGCSVRLLLGAEPAQVTDLMRRHHFDMVLISTSEGEPLVSLRRLVEAAKTATAQSPPVVIGGTNTAANTALGIDIASVTGADCVTSDLDEAIRFCGLKISLRRSATRGPGRQDPAPARARRP